MPLRITTWNVNGIRNPFAYQPWRDRRTFDGMFDILEADIVIMQELKIQRKDLKDDMVLVPGWDCYFSLPKHKKGYSGVGIYTRNASCAPIRAEEGVLGVLSPPGSSIAYQSLPEDQHIGGYHSPAQLATLAEIGVDPVMLDSEGRCVVLEFPAFVIFGIYSPANSSGTRDDFRFGFLNALDMRIRNLVAMGKRVIVCGDLNVSVCELDTAGVEADMRKQGIGHEEYISTPNRRIFNQLLEGGEVIGERDEGRSEPVMFDVCRGFHPQRKGMYTHWEQKINARPGNYGSRIDFILCSLSMKDWFSDSNIQEGLMGSDHCPVFAVLKDNITIDGSSTELRSLLNVEASLKDEPQSNETAVRSKPAFSATLLPEFDRRRSIREMFSFRPTKGASIKGSSGPIALTKAASDVSALSEPLEDVNTSQTAHAFPSPSKPGQNADRRKRNAFESPPQKRSAPSPSPNDTSKRPKGANLKSQRSNGQQSLKGFFKAQTRDVDTDDQRNEDDTNTIEDDEALYSTQTDIPESTKSSRGPSPSVPTDSTDQTVSLAEDEFVHDPIVAKESWTKLFTKPTKPLCEHEEPCKIMKSKKKGFNDGREFWMCARPLGPSGSKERNTQWRCPTFIWSSDWNPGGSTRGS